MKYYVKTKDLIEKAKLSDADKVAFINYSDGCYVYNLIALGETDKAHKEQKKYLQKYGGIRNPGNEKGNNFYMGLLELKKETSIRLYNTILKQIQLWFLSIGILQQLPMPRREIRKTK